MMQSSPLLSVRGLSKHFRLHRKTALWQAPEYLRALEDVSFDVGRGETFAIIGESGSGKTTLARVLLSLEKRTSGEAVFDGTDIFSARGPIRTELRRRIQAVFQDPYTSLNPAHRVDQLISEPWIVHTSVRPSDKETEVARLLEAVGLPKDMVDRYPHQLSGGQRQRIGIARALAASPDLIICDEPLSALDVSVQSQVLNLLLDLQQERGLSYVFIGHDLGVVRLIATRIAVIYLGRIVELADVKDMFVHPRHPYTQALISAMAQSRRQVGTDRIILKGEPPSPANPPSGCPFRTRCWKAKARCAEERPILVEEARHAVACHYPQD